MNIDLEKISWFANTGNFSKEISPGIAIKYIENEAQLIKNLNSNKWANFILYAKNRLSYYIKSFHPAEAKGWNDLAKAAQGWYAQIDPIIKTAAADHHLLPQALPFVKAILISNYIEQYYYTNLSQEIPLHFDKIIQIFSEGHIPCGWEGKMPKNEGYEAINLDSGKILIW
ncbi:hypothetical protein [Pedobacter sp. GR22-6]|uniref:hypothetical protein n=1 Tax=Pedobacter sp. GR22-6 TaxID=3127957 RepID=UPI00307E94B8